MTEPPPEPEYPQYGAPPPPSYGAPQPQHPMYGSPQPAYGQAGVAPNNSSAVVALVLGILSFVACGPFTGIPAIFVGRSAIRQIDQSGGREGGRGLAQAGLWLGVANTVLAALVVVGFVVIIALAAGTST
ncbi:MAG: DUF4190 domain-containing protein [Nocardioides sp.]